MDREREYVKQQIEFLKSFVEANKAYISEDKIQYYKEQIKELEHMAAERYGIDEEEEIEKDCEEEVKPVTDTLNRETAIGKDDIMNLEIAFQSAKSFDEFLNMI